MNSLKKDEGIPFLNFEERPRVPLLNFRGGPRSQVQGSWSHFYTMPRHTFTPCPSQKNVLVRAENCNRGVFRTRSNV